MNAFSRRGACPALSTPMQTGDGLLVRLNPVAGGLSAKSLIGLGESALRHGNGIMEVTARGSLQIRGLTAESARLLAAEVDALGIAVRSGVPVETGPLAGIDPQDIADPRPLAERIRTAIEEAELTARLGPKVSVVVDGGGQLSLDAVTADVRLKAVRCGEDVRWGVLVAGDARSAKPLATVDADAARDIAVAALRMVAEKGRDAHTRDLSERQLASLASWHSVTSVLPDISPSRGEIIPSARLSPIFGLARGEPAQELPISPLEGEMSGRTERGAQEREPAGSPIGTFKLSNNQALGIALPYGSMPAQNLIDLATQALNLGATEIRLAPGRALLFLGLSPTTCASLRASAAALGFVNSSADPRTRIAACPGTPACASGRIATRAMAETIATESPDLLDTSLTLHISGCAKGCAHPGAAMLTLVGDENGAGLVVDGTAKALPAAYRPGYDAARGVAGIAAAIHDARHQGETAAACLTRLGAAGIAELYRRN
ncbi:precorrin-3B synthase [Mesorhizobium sp. M2D.F.Ca.ET.185.01.1.1]|uniref:precorrin-3B synthase n=1 Tax=unclassified Mesorhizobium TaxID=325217 RepID=UPI000FCC1432|nr:MULTISPECIES: precorrin-3B synthase [unclassified Mesorhizobium]TGP80301.1 precorrin-3B synthase [bacterium M00.F.Ca.ET.227.01.1.1]TGQ00729.1 precorrin-3B synthase [bacterium M00.F.Ca.ET.221.01.1.1]TGQ02750.1 precorrin-3B synthase [bacterium M00.F.Ca.ET.222.01.1.1]TGT97625.1 precorrin-3B synthase [bacterium M00.F.Ca.ET.163.01.1.1]TGU20151.1 precorrin-3B synthase [bacterium M00.F.Ca.ET.156.01.1.1]TGU44690.1 precorrin-3B synthase [bacterium M00.F.Ca.ET.146.01.1.1]TGV72364.1 precorrin-3B syn